MSSQGRGERSELHVLEAVVVLVDDNRAHIATQLGPEFDIDLMDTEIFINWMSDRFNMPNAGNAWAAIQISAGGLCRRRGRMIRFM